MAEEDVRSRVLSKVIGGTVAGLPSADPETTPVTFTGGEGWRSFYDAAGHWILYNIQTFDLSGYVMQEATLFPQTVLFQDMDTCPVANNMGTAVPVKRATILSTTPIAEADLTNGSLSGNTWHLPGSNESTYNLGNILQGRIQSFMQLDTFAGLQRVSTSVWGSGDSTAGEKLWYIDAYILPAIASLNFAIPDQAVVIPSIITNETELEYMMRLSRSLEPVY